MSNQLSIVVVLSSLVGTACTQDEGAPVELSPTARTELAALGISAVSQTGDAFVLEDDEGRAIGDVRFADGALDAQLLANRVHSQTDESAIFVECNGNGASLARGNSIPTSTASLLSPCADVLRVAEILTGKYEEQSPGVGLAPACIFLGANEYCQGTTLVRAFDSLCYDAIGWERIESVTYFTPQAIVCQ